VPAFDWTASDPRVGSLRELPALGKWLRLGLRHRARITDLLYLFSTSATRFLSERFESEHVKAALGWHAINDSLAGPSDGGTAYVLLHDHASEAGGVRQWGFVRGGMGTLSSMMADAARQVGCQVRTDAEVERVITRRGRAVGVRLTSGEEISAPTILSNADPKRTFLSLCEPDDLPAGFLERIRAYRCDGTSIKINLALSGLPTV